MHTIACEEIVQLLPLDNNNSCLEPSSAFQRCALPQLMNKDEVTLFGTHGHTSKFIVLADKALSFEAEVPLYSICTVRVCGNRKYVHCKDIRCRKSAFKMVHNVVDLKTVCCHLKKLIPTLSCDGVVVREEENLLEAGKCDILCTELITANFVNLLY